MKKHIGKFTLKANILALDLLLADSRFCWLIKKRLYKIWIEEQKILT